MLEPDVASVKVDTFEYAFLVHFIIFYNYEYAHLLQNCNF